MLDKEESNSTDLPLLMLTMISEYTGWFGCHPRALTTTAKPSETRPTRFSRAIIRRGQSQVPMTYFNHCLLLQE